MSGRRSTGEEPKVIPRGWAIPSGDGETISCDGEARRELESAWNPKDSMKGGEWRETSKGTEKGTTAFRRNGWITRDRDNKEKEDAF